jgi:uncharacterized protein YkwD
MILDTARSDNTIAPVVIFGSQELTMFIRSAAFVTALSLVGAQESETVDKWRDDLHKAINDLRAEGKVAPLKRNAKLDAAAQKHAENMARQYKFGDDLKNLHVLDGKGPVERLAVEQYAFTQFGENIAFTGPGASGKTKGDTAVASALKFWQGSAIHYKNVMNTGFSESGMGMAQTKAGKWYVCAVFASPQKK